MKKKVQVHNIPTEDIIKTDSKNCVIVHSTKNSWNREEVIELLVKALKREGYNIEFGQRTDIQNWIDENL